MNTDSVPGYGEIFAAIPIAATLIDAEGIIVDVNPAFVTWACDLGYEVTREGRLGHRLDAFATSDEHRTQIVSLVDRVLSGHDVTRLKERFSDNAGRAAHVNVNAKALRNDDGTVVGAIILREDVTEEVRRQELWRVLARVRQEVDRMTGSHDMERVLIAVRDGLHQVAPQFSNCGVNLVEDGDPPGVLQHSMTGGGRWMRPLPDDPGEEIVVGIWRSGKTVYRADLDAVDEYSEADDIQSDFGERIRCVIDVPFSRGTLAVNSTRPNAFTPEDFEAFEAMARVLSSGFTRMEDFGHLEARNRSLEVEIAGRKRAQRTLTESEARYRDLVENMPVALSHTTPDGQIIYQNPASMEIHGYSSEELSRMRADDLYRDPSDRQKFLRVLREKGVYSFEHRLRHKKGHTVWVRGTTRAMRDGQGEIIFFHGIAEDVTDQKREESMRLARQRLRDAVWSMRREEDLEDVLATLRDCIELLEVPAQACSVHVIDESGGSISVRNFRSRPGETDWQVSYPEQPAEAVLQMWREGMVMSRPDLQERDDFNESDFLRELWGYPVRSILNVPFSNGTVGVNNSEPRAFTEQDVQAMGELTEVLSEGFRRLQDLRNLERRLQELEREMAERKQLEGQLRQAQKMEAVGELTAGVAHNFNNMLQTVVGSISIAMRQAPAGVRDLLQDAESSAHRAAEMIRHLLVFSRKGIQPLHDSLDVASLLADAVDVVRRTFDRRIAIDFDRPTEAIHAMGDAGQLEQVFLNLCLNARDALETKPVDNPRISVSLTSSNLKARDLIGHADARPGPYGRIVVSDNGVGMDELTVERIFEPFFTTKSVDRGTGLGLSTVYGIARQHGGWITCDSEPGKGTTFAVYIPAVEAPEIVEARTSEIDPKGGSETVLVIDDEEMVRRTATRMLELYGYRVIEGEGGVHGLEVFKAELDTIDLVLLDLSMPQKSGPEVLSEMRELDPEVKVILFTGYSTEATMPAEVAGILQKPFTPAEMATEVRAVLDSHLDGSDGPSS